jgi:hypothetical protein
MKTALDYLKESIEETNIPEQWYEIEIAEMMDWYADYYHEEQLNIYGVSNCFKIEVHNKNGAWYEIVLANTYNEAKSKVEIKYPNNTHISLESEYDKPIF